MQQTVEVLPFCTFNNSSKRVTF